MNEHTDTAFDPATRRATRAYLEQLGAVPNRTLGQNFLTDKNALERIVRLAELQKTDSVLEIGPGLGALTCRLVQHAGEVVAVEKDLQLAQFLPTQIPAERLRLIGGDALKVSWQELGLPEADVKIVANLPYSISKPFLRRVYEEWRPHLTTATLMLQKEVANRLSAAPGTSEYGPMAIMASLYSETKTAFHLGPGAFWPPPEVSSSVIHVRLLQQPRMAVQDEPFFWHVVRAAFSQRRKQLINTLRAVSPEKKLLTAALEFAQIDPMRRGETLSLAEFVRLAETLKAQLP